MMSGFAFLRRDFSCLFKVMLFISILSTVSCSASNSLLSTGSRKTERIILTDIKQLKKANSIYVVNQEIDLNSKTVEIPQGSTLIFKKGKLVNGELKCNETLFSGKIALRNCILSGTVLNEYMTPEMFGAQGDGKADDTDPLGYAINSSCDLRLNNKYRVTRPYGDKRAAFLYQVPKGKRIEGKGIIIMESTVALFLIHSVSDISISGITLDFSRIGSCKSCFNSNHGVVIVNSSNVEIGDVSVISTKGDGIYIGSYNDINNHNRDIRIKGSSFQNFGRQGISVIEGKEIQIWDCSFNNNEQFGYGGVDIEPNHDYEACDVSISHCTFTNCGINTHRDSKQLNRNNKISIKNNTIYKQRRIVGGAGSHYIGISVQDATFAEVAGNKVSGFAGVSCYNCDTCLIEDNQISSVYRGLKVVAVDKVDITNNSIDIVFDYDYTNDKQINSNVVKDVGFTVEVSSSNGKIDHNIVYGNIWIRNSKDFTVTNNICNGKNGSILLYANYPDGDYTKAIVTGNTLGAEGSDVAPIIVGKGTQSIVFDISNNRIKKNNRGIKYPVQTNNARVANNQVCE